MTLAVLPAIAVGFALWHTRHLIAAALDAWRRSHHPDQLGPIRRADTTRSTR